MVAFPNANTIFSGARDNTLRVWRKTKAKPPTFENTILRQSHGFVNSVAFFHPAGNTEPDGLVAHGGAEALIEVNKPTATPSDSSFRLLVGHANNICALATSPSGNSLVSGGWDSKAIVWNTKTWEPVRHLVHESDEPRAVWAVLPYEEHLIITGSADKRIRIFNLKSRNDDELPPQRIIHTDDVVRALCKLPTEIKNQHPSGAQFASAGNDGVIRLWRLDGSQVGTLIGHDSFIYSLAALPTGDIASSGEDRTLRIWRGSECVQTITHPAISVWAVAVCPENGDIVSGASDNVIRVFTRSSERAADPDVVTEFKESVRASAIPGEQVGTAVNRENLNDKRWLAVNRGTKDGQVKMIKEDDGSVSAYQWSNGKPMLWCVP